MKKAQIFIEAHNLKNPYGGLGQFNFHLLDAMSRLDLEGLEITLNVKDPKKWSKQWGGVFRYRKYRSLDRHRGFRIRRNYDLWHSLNQNIKVEPAHRLNYLLTVHDVHFLYEGSAQECKKARSRFEEKLDRAATVVFISEYARSDTEAHFNLENKRLKVIYNGNPITTVAYPSDYFPEIRPDRPFLFSIGDFSTRKNFKTLVAMLVHLPNMQLVLAGNDESTYGAELKQMAKALGVADRVLMTGRIGDDQKKFYLSHCRGLVFPSLREGFGLPPIEAMAYGKPVFLSRLTSLPEVGGDLANYWDSFEPKQMAEIVRTGLEQFDATPEAKARALKQWAGRYNWSNTAQQYLDLYRDILA